MGSTFTFQTFFDPSADFFLEEVSSALRGVWVQPYSRGCTGYGTHRRAPTVTPRCTKRQNATTSPQAQVTPGVRKRPGGPGRENYWRSPHLRDPLLEEPLVLQAEPEDGKKRRKNAIHYSFSLSGLRTFCTVVFVWLCLVVLLVICFILVEIILVDFAPPPPSLPASLQFSPFFERLPLVDFSRYPILKIENIRNHTVRNYNETDLVLNWYTREFDIRTLVGVDFVVDVWQLTPGGHVWLTFRFENPTAFLALSVEARLPASEPMSLWKGFFNAYPLVYIAADEKDILGLRALTRDDPVYIYPGKATPEMAQQIFVEMLHRSNKLAFHPEWYNTLFNNCVGNVANHINRLSPHTISAYDFRLQIAGLSGQYAYDMGLLETDGLTYDQLRRTHKINCRALRALHATSVQFSKHIRKWSHRVFWLQYFSFIQRRRKCS
ncbi:putative membrane protein [Paratrimastix pyriformis]|uniref:Membrane protein n=1 Tax=Paratrimastix pyriformis TaxID=342808 RepID=A0ABQ8UFT2_9EUKA|nr:putative membrane protein [Paratrimastix pyriformis]